MPTPSTRKKASAYPDNQQNARLINEAWHWVSDLPIEQSLVLGGGGSLAFFELAKHARTFLQDNMRSVLSLLFPTFNNNIISQITHVPTVTSQKISPLIARNGVVEAMLLTRTGIFYLKTDGLTLYQAVGYCETANPGHEEYIHAALSKLSPYALHLYNEARQKGEESRDNIQDHLREKFEQLLDDCLLHMILNDLSRISRMDPAHLTPIKPIAINLIQKITLTQPQGNTNWGQYAWRFLGYYRGQATATVAAKSSTQCLREWTTENGAPAIIQQQLKDIFIQYLRSEAEASQKLFFRDSDEWRQNPIELPPSRQTEQWRKSLSVTGCTWNRAIGPLRIELEMTAPDADDVDWKSTARLRYTINH